MDVCVADPAHAVRIHRLSRVSIQVRRQLPLIATNNVQSYPTWLLADAAALWQQRSKRSQNALGKALTAAP